MLTLLNTPLGKLRLLGVVALLAIVLFSAEAISRMNGGSDIIGLSPTTSGGCSCHGGTASTSTTLSASSATGSFTVETGSATNFTVNVSNASQAAAGTNIAVKTSATGTTNAGTLSVASGSGLQVVSGEITHNTPKTMSGGTAAFTFTWTAPTDHGTYYLQAIGNAVNGNSQNTGDLWNWMTAQAITVAGVKLTSPNGGATYCAGSNVTINFTSTAVTNVKIELSNDGGATWPTTIVASTSAAAGSYTWAIPSNQTAGTNYRIRVSDAATSTRLDASDASFSIATPPAITTQPTAQTICVNDQLSLSVTATGTSPTYQWRRNGTNIAGATSATYSVTNASAADAGSYDVQVTNSCTTATSTAVNVTVNAAPAISTQPTAQTACVGQPATFTVAATGTGLTYQWRKGGVNIAGATTASYTIPTVATGDAGNYDVVVSGTCNPSRTSNAVALTVRDLPAITSHPTAVTVCAGQPASFTVSATGSGLTYQWRRNGTNIPGATSSTYSIGSASSLNAGNIDVVVSGNCSPPATSNAATLTVNPTPNVTSDPMTQVACEGSNVTLTVAASGTGLSYQWRRNGADIPNATTNSLTITSVSASDLGGYDVVVTQGDCFVVSATAIVTMRRPAEITGQPTDKSGVAGSTIELNVTASGDDVAYQWKKNGTNVANATGARLTLSNVTVADAGTYTVEVRNACTTLTSNPATVTVLAPGAGAVISLSPSTVDFGPTRVGVMKERVMTGIIRNAGDSVLTITTVAVAGPNAAEFALAPVTVPLTIAPGESASLTVRFTPTSVGAKTATVNFTSNAKQAVSLALVGQGAVGALTATMTSVGFGGVALGATSDTTVQLCNTSDVVVSITGVSLLGSEPFSVVDMPPFPIAVQPGQCLEVKIRFAPTTDGNASDILTIRTDGQPANITIGLSGTGGASSVPVEARVVESLAAMPNPATDAVTIAMTLARPTTVDVVIVDARGAIVRRFAGDEASTAFRFVWDGRTERGDLLSSGTYRIVAHADGQVSSTAVVIVR
jgi:hypothetical protein